MSAIMGNSGINGGGVSLLLSPVTNGQEIFGGQRYSITRVSAVPNAIVSIPRLDPFDEFARQLEKRLGVKVVVTNVPVPDSEPMTDKERLRRSQAEAIAKAQSQGRMVPPEPAKAKPTFPARALGAKHQAGGLFIPQAFRG